MGGVSDIKKLLFLFDNGCWSKVDDERIMERKKYNEAIIYIISQQHISLTIKFQLVVVVWQENAASTHLNESCKNFFRLM